MTRGGRGSALYGQCGPVAHRNPRAAARRYACGAWPPVTRDADENLELEGADGNEFERMMRLQMASMREEIADAMRYQARTIDEALKLGEEETNHKVSALNAALEFAIDEKENVHRLAVAAMQEQRETFAALERSGAVLGYGGELAVGLHRFEPRLSWR